RGQQRAAGHPRAHGSAAAAGSGATTIPRSWPLIRPRSFVLLSFSAAFALLRVAERPARTAGPSPAAAPSIAFTDATSAAGIHFRHNSGAFGKKYLPETMGAGALFVDLDGDGWPDLFFVNSKNWPGRPGPPTPAAFYRNNHDGTFTDATRGSGLDVPVY